MGMDGFVLGKTEKVLSKRGNQPFWNFKQWYNTALSDINLKGILL